MICINCQKNNFSKVYATNNWEILQCKECHLVTTKNNKFVDYSSYHRDEEYFAEEKLFRNIFQKRFNTIKTFKKSGRVLDIGASHGVMLDIFAQDGWETFGVEPSRSAERAKSNGHTIYQTSFEKAKLKNNFFDVVILNHTLEHVNNPAVVLKKVKSVLNPGGIVYIDVPNFDSFSRKFAGSSWKYLLPKEHVFHFTPKTLNSVASNSGLKVIWESTWSGIFDVANPVQMLWYKLTNFKKSLFTDILSIPGNIVATLFNRGTNIAIIAKK